MFIGLYKLTAEACSRAESSNRWVLCAIATPTKIESTVRYLGIDADDALQLAERVEL